MTKYRIYSYDNDTECYELLATVFDIKTAIEYSQAITKGYILKEIDPTDPYITKKIWSSENYV